MARGNRIVVFLDGGDVSRIVSDDFHTEILLVNGDDTSQVKFIDVDVDYLETDRYFDKAYGRPGS